MLASTDGGINGEARSSPFPNWFLQYWVFGTETLYARTPQGIDVVIPFYERMSYDGGRTWESVVENPEPLDAMPAGAVPLCLPHRRDCPLQAADPVTRTVRPLRNQPPVPGPDVQQIRPDGGLWATGWDKARRQRLVTSSRDDGRTWSTHVVSPSACTDEGGSFSLDTIDGRTVYARTYAPATVCRSIDGGVTWQSMPADPHMEDLDVALAAPDNTHVIGWLVVDDPNRPDYVQYAASRDGGPYVKIATAPMSTWALMNVRAAAGGGAYVTWDSYGVFRSDDALTWYRVLPPE